MILVPFPDMVPLAAAVAAQSGAVSRPLAWRQFPDGESLVTLPAGLADADVAIVATLRDPDRLALPLRFAAATARGLGARRVGLIAPYLGYMRQDRQFAEGQAVSAPLFAAFLGESFDWLITADPHLHRIARLEDLFAIPALRVATAPLLAEWIRAHLPDAVLFGPDEESRQWVAEVAQLTGRPHEVLRKRRSGDRDVSVTPPGSDTLPRGTPVILDDIASTGSTMVRAIARLREAGAAPPVCVVIHGIFAGNALADLMAAGACNIVTTDTVPHPTNAISVAGKLADAMAQLPQSLSS